METNGTNHRKLWDLKIMTNSDPIRIGFRQVTKDKAGGRMITDELIIPLELWNPILSQLTNLFEVRPAPIHTRFHQKGR